MTGSQNARLWRALQRPAKEKVIIGIRQGEVRKVRESRNLLIEPLLVVVLKVLLQLHFGQVAMQLLINQEKVGREIVAVDLIVRLN